MKRQLTNPNKDKTIVNTIKVYEGGTGATTVPVAQENLDILPSSLLGQPNGAAVLPANGIVTSGMIEGGIEPVANLYGPTRVIIGTSASYFITNYDMQQTYIVSSTGGSITRSKDTIVYTANSTVENGTITINGRVFTIQKYDQVPYKPSVIAPVDNATDISASVAFTTSMFQTDKVGDTHASSDWQVAADPEFTEVIYSSLANTTEKTTWTAKDLRANSTLFMRVRFRSSSGKESEWSTTKVFSTKAAFGPTAEVQKLIGSDTAASDAFGTSAAISTDGTTLIVGAYNNNFSRGAVYVFVKSGNSWTQQAKLLSSDLTVNDSFGWSVALSANGNYALVGAYNKSNQAGAAYVFLRTGTTWAQEAKLTPSDIADGDWFGRSVSLNGLGAIAVIGAPGKDGSVGAAYVFTRAAATWTQRSKLTLANSSWFGYSVSSGSSGTTLLVGSPKTSTVATFTTVDSITWTLQQSFKPPASVPADEFGISVALSSDSKVAVIGAPKESISSTSMSGAAYVYTFSGVSWVQSQKLIASDIAVSAMFGSAVSASDDGGTLIVGAKVAKLSGNSVGALYTFTRSSAVWTQQKKLTASDAAANDGFTVSAALSQNSAVAIVGAPGKNSAAGSAYIFQ